MAKEDKAPESNEETGKEVAKPAEGTVVKFSDKIWIEGTGNSVHMKKGKKYQVQELHGNHLIAKGAAVKTDAPAKKVEAKK